MKQQKRLLNSITYHTGNARIWTSLKHLAVKMLCPVLLLSLFTLVACNNDEPEPEPEPPVSPTVITMKMKSQEVAEFKEKQAGQALKDLPVEKVNEYFGKRVELCCPTELQVKDDSLYMVKPGGIIEKYKMQWLNGDLMLYNDQSAGWEFCGKREGDNKIALNIGFYMQKIRSEQRTLSIMGQEYALKSFSDISDLIGNDENASVVWLHQQIVFE